MPRTLLLLVAFVLTGCCAAAPAEPPARETNLSVSPPESQPLSLVGRRFLSVEKREAGNTPKGVVMGHWHVTFENEREVHWHYSDVIEVGEYELADDGVITVRMGNRRFTAKYDPATGELHWQDMVYRAEAPAAG